MTLIFPKLELTLYVTFWFTIVIYTFYQVQINGEKLVEGLFSNTNLFQPGWQIIGRQKDISDYEWNVWIPFAYKILPWALLHIPLSELIRWYDVEALPIFHFIYFVLTLGLSHSFLLVSFYLIVSSVFLLSVFYGVKGIVWPISFLWIITIQSNCEFLLEFILPKDVLSHNLLPWSFGWLSLKGIDFCMYELTNKNENKLKLFFCFVGYIFYLPNFILGPFFAYKEFKQNLNRSFQPWTVARAKTLLLDLMKIAVYSLMFEIILHYFYCNIITIFPLEQLESSGAWTVYGLGLCLAEFFYLKYLVMYGFAIAIGKAEGYKTPLPPICVNRVYLYSDMWRYFDQGFYNFVINNIYIPSNVFLPDKYFNKTLKRLLASFFCFIFVFIWHGVTEMIFLWSVLNFIGITFEVMGQTIRKSERIKSMEIFIGPNNTRRLTALVAAPFWILAVASNFMFFTNMSTGIHYLHQIITADWKVQLLLLVLAYCTCQISIQMNYETARKLKKRR